MDIGHNGQRTLGRLPYCSHTKKILSNVISKSAHLFPIELISVIKVSWLRCSDVVVLTVGSLVFSSDPRMGVVHLPRPWQEMSVWALRISQVAERDQGVYQCQVNTEPKISLPVNLAVAGRRKFFFIKLCDAVGNNVQTSSTPLTL